MAPHAAPDWSTARAGDRFETFRRTLTQADLTMFTGWAGLRHPMFVDHEAAGAGRFGGPVAPGFMILSFAAGMIESLLGDGLIAGLGFDEMRFTAPVRPGDTLHAAVEIAQIRGSRRPGEAVATLRVGILNQRGEAAVTYAMTVLVKRP